MISDGGSLVNKIHSKSTPGISTTDNIEMNISHIRDVSSSNLSLPNALLVPKLALNLISVGQICEHGFEVLFSNHGYRVQDPQSGQIVGTGCKVGQLYEVVSMKIPTQTYMHCGTAQS